MPPHNAYLQRPKNVENNQAKAHGWGEGWPACEEAEPPLRNIAPPGSAHAVKVRKEIADLVTTLLQATGTTHGYPTRYEQTWSYDCREIERPDGTGTGVPSNHSWGLAVDINAEANPRQSTWKCDIPPAVVAMWWACGFFWGGWYSQNTPYDPMHFEYVGRPVDVAGHLAKARSYLPGHDGEDEEDMRPYMMIVDGDLDQDQPDGAVYALFGTGAVRWIGLTEFTRLKRDGVPVETSSDPSEVGRLASAAALSHPRDRASLD